MIDWAAVMAVVLSTTTELNRYGAAVCDSGLAIVATWPVVAWINGSYLKCKDPQFAISRQC